jgi:hypothetical protein
LLAAVQSLGFVGSQANNSVSGWPRTSQAPRFFGNPLLIRW